MNVFCRVLFCLVVTALPRLRSQKKTRCKNDLTTRQQAASFTRSVYSPHNGAELLGFSFDAE